MTSLKSGWMSKYSTIQMGMSAAKVSALNARLFIMVPVRIGCTGRSSSPESVPS